MSDETAVTIVDGEPVNPATGEVVPVEQFTGYAGVASLSLTQDQRDTFDSILGDEEHDILPTGEVYVPQVHYRRRLNRVFGPGSWAMVPRGPYDKQGKTLIREYALVVRGSFVSEATGEANYHENNARMSYASAAEAVKSNAIMRCCKDLGIGWECWDPRWTSKFKAEHCVKVWRKSETKPQWRRKDKEAWYDEKGDKATGGQAAQRAESQKPSQGGVVCPHCESTDIGEAQDGAAFCKSCSRGI